MSGAKKNDAGNAAGNAAGNGAENDAGNDGIVWRPTEEQIAASNMRGFLDAHGVADYEALQRRSQEEPAWFWDAVIQYCDIRFYEPYHSVLDLSGGLPWPKWCVGGKTNAVLNLLDKHRETPVWDRLAIIWEGEDGTVRRWSYAELDAEVCRFAGGLRSLGFGPGDPIALYAPFLPESVAAMLAIVKIGAVVMPLFSGFGVNAVVDRMKQAGTVAVVTVDGTLRRGEVIQLKPVIDEAAALVPTLRHSIVIRNRGPEPAMRAGRDLWWHELRAGQPSDAPTEVMEADAPALLLFTSGTTGRSKGCILTHCGFPTKLSLDFQLVMDYRTGDRLMWMSDMGWVVGPMVTFASLLFKGSMVIAEGGPDYPDPGRMWRLVDAHQVNFLGVAPTVIRTLMQYGEQEVAPYDLSSLRAMTSSGEPWTPDAWMWAFRNVCRGRIPLHNITGGTEVSGGILCTTGFHPMKPCAFTGPIPGTGADIVDNHGQSVPRGQTGELVMRAPSIGNTAGLWRDEGGARYLESYWSQIPGMWTQGDFTHQDADGFWFVTGRSDDVFNIAGKRTSPSEVESLLLATGRIAQAAVVGVPDPIKGEALLCVCVPNDGQAAGEELDGILSRAVVDGLGRPFRPREIIYVSDLPKTRNMKTMRRVVRAVYQGDEPGDLSSLVNPEAVAELQAVIAGRGK